MVKKIILPLLPLALMLNSCRTIVVITLGDIVGIATLAICLLWALYYYLFKR